MIDRYSFVARPEQIGPWVSEGYDDWMDLWTGLANAVEDFSMVKMSRRCMCGNCRVTHSRRENRVMRLLIEICELMAIELMGEVRANTYVDEDVLGGSLVFQGRPGHVMTMAFFGVHQTMEGHAYRTSPKFIDGVPMRVLMVRGPDDRIEFDDWAFHLGNVMPTLIVNSQNKEFYAADLAAAILMKKVGRHKASEAFLEDAMNAGLGKEVRRA